MNSAWSENYSLEHLNTLKLPVSSRYFVSVNSCGQLQDSVAEANALGLPLLVLGGGSNVVLVDDFPGLCIHIGLRGISAEQQEGRVRVCAGAGENWHAFVSYCLQHGWYGLENLALIPGTVGAAPVQNIGAYGVEIKDTLVTLNALDRQDLSMRRFSLADCAFAYRDSRFKSLERDRYIICDVTFELSTEPRVNLSYQALKQALAAVAEPDPQAVYQTVIALRSAKLPAPEQIPNAGSFFKNPWVGESCYQRLKQQFPQLVAFADEGGYKLAAGWLIDQAGWKGVQRDGVGVHEHQALVLTHRGGGDGHRLLELAEDIQQDIQQRYGVALEIEPRVYGL